MHVFFFYNDHHFHFYDFYNPILCKPFFFKYVTKTVMALAASTQKNKKSQPILRVSGKSHTVPCVQELQDQACIGPDSAKYKTDTCCWPWIFMKSSRLPLLVLSVLFCCRCFSLEAADEWRAFPTPETFPP